MPGDAELVCDPRLTEIIGEYEKAASQAFWKPIFHYRRVERLEAVKKTPDEYYDLMDALNMLKK